MTLKSRRLTKQPKKKGNLPMVLSNISTILHDTPLIPRRDTVDARVPDLLPPDHILEVQVTPVLHHPLGHLPPRKRSRPAAIANHVVDRPAAAVVAAGRRARAVADAEELARAPGELLVHDARAVDGDLLTRARGRERGVRVVAAEAVCVGAAAHHAGGARAFPDDGVASAIRDPAAVAVGAVVAGGLGAALDVGGVAGAGVVDGAAAGGFAVCGRDADAWEKGEKRGLLAGGGNVDERGRRAEMGTMKVEGKGRRTGDTVGSLARLVDGGQGRGSREGEEETLILHGHQTDRCETPDTRKEHLVGRF